LVERDAHLTALAGAWEQVRRTRHGSLVLVRGEAGSGKTALVDAFRDGLGVPVWTGTCQPLTTPRPLAPFADLAAQLGGELAEVVSGEGRPYDVAAALGRAAAAQGEAVVVLEDLHWADDATLDALRLLARAVRDRAMLVVATYRDDEVERFSPFQVVLGDLCGPGTLRVDVGRLSVKALRELGASDPEELYALTGGNAFYASEVLLSGSDALPATVVDAVLGRLGRLSPEARALAEAVSVVPQRCELWLLDPTGLDEAVTAGVLHADDTTVAFRHELARRAVEGTLPPYKKTELHRRTLAALAERGAEPARLVHHAIAAQDSPAVLVHATAAAERASRQGAKREAATHWEQALQHVPEDDRRLRAEVLERLSHAMYLVDRMDEAVAKLEEALAIWRELDERLAEGRVLNDLVRRLACAGRDDECEAVIDIAGDILRALPPSSELALNHGLRATNFIDNGDLDSLRLWTGRAIALSRELGDVYPEVYALNTLGVGQLCHGLSYQPLLDSLALAREIGHDEAVGRAYLNLCGQLAEQKRVDELPLLLEGVAECERRGLELWRRYLVVHVAELQVVLGQWDEAMAGVAEILALRSSAPLLRLSALIVAARVRMRRGDPGAAEALDEAEKVLDGRTTLEWTRQTTLARAELAWHTGAAGDETAAEIDALTSDALAHARAADLPSIAEDLLRWRRLSGLTDPSDDDLRPDPEHWRAMGSGWETAMALLEHGEPVEALSLLQLTGALGTANRVAADLRAAGIRELPRGPRSTTRANPAQLTDRELEVLALVTEGRSNAAIATELVLSTKTVDKHVSAALRKLGVSSRREASAAYADLVREPATVD
jgi:DNA-binding CsgD family transcriptional regulator/tetratricopeptide (TPR) repeat protein